ncbi:MAG: Asp23/Gls24 family envelope stress response protein [Dictyoglomaceae bacterium]
MKEELSYGSVKISKEVISIIAGIAAQEVKGVSRVGDNLPSTFEKLVSGIPIGRGIKVEIKDKDVYIFIPIYVLPNYFFPEVSREVQNHVKEVVESMTGLNVQEVNILIKGVYLGKKEEKK